MPHHTVTRDRAAWLAARRALLEQEKIHTRAGDELALARRQLPWLPVDKPYAFDTPAGRRSLSELFGPQSQLVVYHFMFGPDSDSPCRSCSFWADHFGAAVPHLAARDVALVAASRAPLTRLDAFARRQGWSHPWVSCADASFNVDFDVSFRPQDVESGRASYNYSPASGAGERHGVSVFAKDDSGLVYHTYSSYARGAECMNSTYPILDLTPKGRNEGELPFSMGWVRYRDEYSVDSE